MQGDDVVALDGGHDSSFAKKALPALHVGGYGGLHHFECDGSMQRGIDRAKDVSHSALAKEPKMR